MSKEEMIWNLHQTKNKFDNSFEIERVVRDGDSAAICSYQRFITNSYATIAL